MDNEDYLEEEEDIYANTSGEDEEVEEEPEPEYDDYYEEEDDVMEDIIELVGAAEEGEYDLGDLLD